MGYLVVPAVATHRRPDFASREESEMIKLENDVANCDNNGGVGVTGGSTEVSGGWGLTMGLADSMSKEGGWWDKRAGKTKVKNCLEIEEEEQTSQLNWNGGGESKKEGGKKRKRRNRRERRDIATELEWWRGI